MMRRWMLAPVLLFAAGCGMSFTPVGDAPEGGPRTPPAPGESVPVTRMELSEASACILAGGELHYWGGGRYGETYDAGDAVLTPTRGLAGHDDLIDVACGGVFHCGLTSSGRVVCEGRDIGHEALDGAADEPSFVDGLGDAVVDIAGAHWSLCAVRADGDVYCMGRRATRADGACDESVYPSSGPERVEGLSNIEEVALGRFHRCARDGEGAVLCWGCGDHGQLGTGEIGSRGEPTRVELPAPAVQLALASRASCALLADGTVHCWGQDLANGFDDVLLPRAVPTDGVVVRIDAERATLCGVNQDASSWCLGAYGTGQSETACGGASVREPTPEPRLIHMAQVSGGTRRCGSDLVGNVYCWGCNLDGTVGDGTTGYVDAPVHVFP